MKATHENPFDTLSELELNSPTEFDLISEKEIKAELRFSEDLVDIGPYDVTVSVSSAILYLKAWGSQIVPGSRLADQARSQVNYEQKIRKRTTLKRAQEVGATLSGGSAGPKAGISGTRTNLSEEEVELEVTQQISRNSVRSMSGNRWRIQEGDPDSDPMPLDGTYIANEILCAVSPSENANTISVEALIVARKRDFIVTPSGNSLQRELRERIHREKFMSAVLAKCLAEQSDQSNSANETGRFILSRSTLSLDDES